MGKSSRAHRTQPIDIGSLNRLYSIGQKLHLNLIPWNNALF
ncbi:hypothetical protein NVIRPANT_01076 [Pantoea sp. Nvir]|nr:hypothetical protein NVIRPANT_01076 [Pantoea sp. Nvir]